MKIRFKSHLLAIFYTLLLTSPVALFAEAPEGNSGNSQKTEIRGDIEAATKGWALIEEGALLIDVRSGSEFAEGHVPGSINIAHTKIDALVAAIGDDSGRNVVVYCRSGNRSGKAQAKLQDLGYTAIFNATGYDALLATQP